MIQDLFIIDAKNENPCIFYGQIEQSPQPPNLAEILSMFIQKSSALPTGKFDTTQTGQGKFLFSNFDKIFVILKVLPSGEMNFAEKFLKNVAERFIQKYGKDLETYAGDVSVFAGFSDMAADIYSDLQETLKQKTEVPAIPPSTKEIAPKPAGAKGEQICPECKGSNPAGSTFCLECGASLGASIKTAPPIGQPKPPAPTPSAAPAKATDFMRAPEPIKFTPQKLPSKETASQAIKPMKREAYPDGIPEYSRDEVLWNESQSVMNEYSAEFVEDSVSKLSMALSISLQHHYTLEIDFTNYPERPIISISQGLQDEIGQPLNEALSFMKAWDPKIPPHIIEIVRELEALLTKLKTQGKLTATAEMPETALPDLVPLQPLPKLSAEEEARLKKYEAQKKAEKLATEKQAGQKATEGTPAAAAGPAAKTGVPCPACKHINPPGSAFCMGCGKKFEGPAAKPPSVDKKELKRLEKEKKLQEKQKSKEEKQKGKEEKQKEKPEKTKDAGKKQEVTPEKEPEEEPATEEEEPEEEKEDE